MIHAVIAPGLRCEVAVDPGALGGFGESVEARDAGAPGLQGGPGGRIVSLRSDDGHEWLAPSTAPSGIAGESFVRSGMGGWDEVAPSVQADVLGDGVSVPDHGDVWNAPWTVLSATASALVMEVRLRSLPVTLQRTIAATETGLRLSYRATTEVRGGATDAVRLLWCAHPQFAGGAGATVALEHAGTRISPTLVEVHPVAGRTRVFPTPPLHESLPIGGSLKAFVRPDTPVDAALLTLVGGRSLRLRWSADELPYLGLFWDNGEFAASPVLVIEPSTGWGDVLSEATRLGRVRTLSAAAPLEWSLELSA